MGDLYQIVVFLHIVSAFIMFSSWFFELMLVFKSEEDGTSWQPVVKYTALLQMVCMVLVFISGVYMMRKAWGPQPWLATSVVLLLSTIVVTVLLSVLAKRKREAFPDTKTNTVSLITSIYKVGTALVILMLMVFKNIEYDQTFIVVIASYLVIFGLSLVAYRWRNTT